jgi:hypothetical protein
MRPKDENRSAEVFQSNTNYNNILIFKTRFDDLVSWFYVIIELFDPASAEVSQTAFPFPWDFCPENSQVSSHTLIYFTHDHVPHFPSFSGNGIHEDTLSAGPTATQKLVNFTL